PSSLVSTTNCCSGHWISNGDTRCCTSSCISHRGTCKALQSSVTIEITKSSTDCATYGTKDKGTAGTSSRPHIGPGERPRYSTGNCANGRLRQAVKAKRINIRYRIPPNIGIRIQPTRQPDRIALDIPPGLGVVAAEVVVPEPALGVPILPREPQVQPADAVGGDGAVEDVVARAPDHALARIRCHLRPAQVVGVHHVLLLAAHQAHRLAAGQAQVVRPGTPAPGVLGLHLTAGDVHEPHPGRRAPLILADALAQGIDPVIGGHATAGDLVQAVEAVVTIRVAAAGGGVAAGVVAVARRAGAGDGRQAVAAGVDAVEVGPG